MFVKNTEIKSELAGEGLSRKILGRGGELMLAEMVFAQGAVGEEHDHPHEQVCYVVCGSFDFYLEGQKEVLGPGDSVYVAPNKRHSVVAREPDSKIIDVFTPQREDFLA